MDISPTNESNQALPLANESSQQSVNPFIPPGSPAPAESLSPNPTSKRNILSSMGVKIGSGVFLAVIILFGFSVFAAYGMVPIGKGPVQDGFSNFIIGLPFMPKTPAYVITSALQQHEKVTKFTFDASLAATSTNFTTLLGSGEFDMDFNGPVDYTDPNNPSASLHAEITKDFSADVTTKNHFVYFRINQLPAFVSLILTEFGLSSDTEQKFLNTWFYTDTRPLETEASENLKMQAVPTTPQEEVQKMIKLFDDPAIEKSMSMKTESLDSSQTYHIHFTPSAAVLDSLVEKIEQQDNPQANTRENTSITVKPSDYIDNFVMDTWIDQKQYFVRKVAVSFIAKTPTSSETSSTALLSTLPFQSQSIPVSFVIHLTNFGVSVPIDTPVGAESYDDFIKTIIAAQATNSAGLLGTSPAIQFAQANDTKRRADVNAILNAIDQYAADHQGSVLEFHIPTATPGEISSSGVNICSLIVPTYIASLPSDPKVDAGGNISNCATPYDTGYTIIQSADASITVSAKSEVSPSIPISVTR